MDTCTKAVEADIDALQYENMILKKQLNFLMECITNQMNNLELHRPKRKMRQDYLFFIYLKAMF